MKKKPGKASPAGKKVKPLSDLPALYLTEGQVAFIENIGKLRELCLLGVDSGRVEERGRRVGLSGIKWPDHGEADPYLLELLDHLLWGIFWRAEKDELAAFSFVKLLNDYVGLLELQENCSESIRSVAPFVLEWPISVNARPEFAKERKEKLANLKRWDVAGKHPERTRKALRGGLGASIESYIIQMSYGCPGVPFLPPLNPSNLSEYREKAWELFIREHGEKFENHPAMKSIAPEKLQGQPVSPGKRRDMIRDAWEGAWKTIARQVASQK